MVAVGFVLALAIGSAGLLGGGRALGASTTLTVIGGTVSVRHGAGVAFVVAVDGEVLNAGDAVQTAADGRAVLTYFEGSTVTVEPGTELGIDAAASRGNDTIVQMTQAAGRTWHVVTKLVTGGSKYEVRTPAVTASVRGTEFTVDTTAQETTVTTTEGTVVNVVPDPARPGATVEVPVPAGQQQTQRVDVAPTAPHPAPPPERKVTVTVDASNSIVVDPLGRANGVLPDGKIVVQTPGAQVRRVGDSIVITLPNIPDGALATRVERAKGAAAKDVRVHAVVEDRGGHRADVEDKATVAGDAKAGGDTKAVSGILIERKADGTLETRTLSQDEKAELKESKIREAPAERGSGDETAAPARSATRNPGVPPTAEPGSSDQRTSAPSTSAPATERPRTPEPSQTEQPRGDSNTDAPRSAGPQTSTPAKSAAPTPTRKVDVPKPTTSAEAETGETPAPTASTSPTPTPARSTAPASTAPVSTSPPPSTEPESKSPSKTSGYVPPFTLPTPGHTPTRPTNEGNHGSDNGQ